MDHVELSVAREDGLLLLTLNRPAKRNAFSFELLQALEVEVERAASDDGVRAVVITGAGQEAFSAGMDLALLFEHVASAPTGQQLRKVQHELQSLFSTLEALEKPTVAAIEGHCVGGGLELALACDLRVASSAAALGFPETKLGLLPDLGGTTRLTRLVGPAVAREWILTARSYPAARALELGLITELVPPGDALAHAKRLAREVCANGPLAIAWAKKIIDRGATMSLEDSLLLEQYAMTEILPSADVKEGIAAFLARRPPKFR
jgi:enoyl-CoA hydratase/carnithine racemase